MKKNTAGGGAKSPFGTERVRLNRARSVESGRLVRIEESYKGGKYVCPLCGKPVYEKKGGKQAWNFAHYPGCECVPEDGAIERYVCDLTVSVLEDHRRILLPAQTCRLPSGRAVRFKNPQMCYFEIDGEPRKVEGEAGSSLTQLNATGKDGRKLALIISACHNPVLKTVILAMGGGREVLVIDVYSCTLESDMTRAVEKLLLDATEHKNWASIPEKKRGYQIIADVFPHSAFRRTEEETRCGLGPDSCRKCGFHWKNRKDDLCLYDYLNNRPEVSLAEFGASVPEWTRRTDEWMRKLARTEERSRRLGRAWGYMESALKKLAENAPIHTDGMGSLVQAGSLEKNLDGQSVPTEVFWGRGKHEVCAVLLAPQQKKGNAVLAVSDGMEDWTDGTVHHDVGIFRAPAGTEVPAGLFQGLEAVRKAPGGWQETEDTGKINRLLKTMDALFGSIRWSCSDEYKEMFENFELMPENALYFEENPDNILKTGRLCLFYTSADADSTKGKASVCVIGRDSQNPDNIALGLEWDFTKGCGNPAKACRLELGKADKFVSGDADGNGEAAAGDFIDMFNRTLDLFNNGRRWEPVTGNPAWPGGVSGHTLSQTDFGKGVLRYCKENGKGLEGFYEDLKKGDTLGLITPEVLGDFLAGKPVENAAADRMVWVSLSSMVDSGTFAMMMAGERNEDKNQKA